MVHATNQIRQRPFQTGANKGHQAVFFHVRTGFSTSKLARGSRSAYKFETREYLFDGEPFALNLLDLRDGFGEIDRTRLPAGVEQLPRTAILSAEVDILVSPSAAGPAPATLETTGEPIFSSAWTLAGNPAITLPLFSAAGSGLPIGCQFISGFANDDLLLAASKWVMDVFGSG